MSESFSTQGGSTGHLNHGGHGEHGGSEAGHGSGSERGFFSGSSQHPGSGESRSMGSGSGEASFRWADENGTFSERWMDRLPEEIRGHASLKSIGSVQDLAKSYIHTKGMVGAKLEMPGEQATPEQIANWRRIVGAPERPEGYLGEA